VEALISLRLTLLSPPVALVNSEIAHWDCCAECRFTGSDGDRGQIAYSLGKVRAIEVDVFAKADTLVPRWSSGVDST
jgi:hypothetical protein